MAYIVMAYVVAAHMVTAYTVTAFIVTHVMLSGRRPRGAGSFPTGTGPPTILRGYSHGMHIGMRADMRHGRRAWACVERVAGGHDGEAIFDVLVTDPARKKNPPVTVDRLARIRGTLPWNISLEHSAERSLQPSLEHSLGHSFWKLLRWGRASPTGSEGAGRKLSTSFFFCGKKTEDDRI